VYPTHKPVSVLEISIPPQKAQAPHLRAACEGWDANSLAALAALAFQAGSLTHSENGNHAKINLEKVARFSRSKKVRFLTTFHHTSTTFKPSKNHVLYTLFCKYPRKNTQTHPIKKPSLFLPLSVLRRHPERRSCRRPCEGPLYSSLFCVIVSKHPQAVFLFAEPFAEDLTNPIPFFDSVFTLATGFF
jgi:hypothetical protein